jgi:DNA-binding response OmpR family regulator
VQRRELSQVQFDLLVYLLLNRGRMLAAEELLPIFAKSTSHNKNMVEFHIFHLRRALWPGLIRTVKGQGYTIDLVSEVNLAMEAAQRN